ncbi:MAG: hypothetical protein KatS3mg029_0554 [Saprospiraceae bacterium]|nr:MAG: hypothetical protein KatS3mg029_0554 [Saprospiraceae bacterium]
MKLIKYRAVHHYASAPTEWLETWYAMHMNYLASDLLHFGLSPWEIQSALDRAMKVCKTAGWDVDEHFYPVYTRIGGTLFKDCRLSRQAYALTILNAPEDNPYVARFQVELVRKYFK